MLNAESSSYTALNNLPWFNILIIMPLILHWENPSPQFVFVSSTIGPFVNWIGLKSLKVHRILFKRLLDKLL